MTKPYDKIILEHYRGEAEAHGAAATATMADLRTRELESAFVADFVRKYIAEDATIADLGCGNGITLSEIRRIRPKSRLIGLEFTPGLRQIAEQRFADDPNTVICAGDIRLPITAFGQVDAVICQRVIINLLDRDDQRTAFRNIKDSIKPGGHLLLIEAFESGLLQINAARDEFGLPPLPPAHHNLYLSDTFFDEFEDTKMLLDQDLQKNFLSTHYFVSRVLHPVVLGEHPFIRNSHFVRFFSEALKPGIGSYSPIQGFIFAKS